MYAIVKTGGKQYRVEEGQTLLVERLPADEGATVDLEPVLYRPDGGKGADEAVFDADGLGQVKINARVVGHVRGPKLRVFKFKPKRGYRRTTGHRQELTRLEVTAIEGPGGATKRTRAKAEPSAKAEPQGTKSEAPGKGEAPAKGKGEAEPQGKSEAENKPKPSRASTRSRSSKEDKSDGA